MKTIKIYTKQRRLQLKTQAGAALIISLILLLVLTFLGISSMQTTTLEERMAANQKDYYLAFEAAEFALADAEEFVGIIFSTGDFNATGSNGGLFQGHDLINAQVWKTVNWSDDDLVQVVNGFAMTSEAPKYIVEVMQVVSSVEDSVNAGNEYGEQTGATDTTVFRVTARGVSGKGSVVFLQATIAKAI
jgi:type IV pilus assembly protein PilX